MTRRSKERRLLPYPLNNPGDGQVPAFRASDGNIVWITPATEGGGGEDVQLSRRVDETDDGLTLYVGESIPGVPDTAAAWRIKRVAFIGPEAGDTEITWASGTADFIHRWDQHLALSYS